MISRGRAGAAALVRVFSVDARALAKGLMLVAIIALVSVLEDNPAAAQSPGCSDPTETGVGCATQPALIASRIISDEVQAHIRDSRDWVYYVTRPQTAASPPLGFAADPSFDGDFDPLGYAARRSDNSFPVKATPQPPSSPAAEFQLSVWGTGTADHEHQTGLFNNFNIGSKTDALGGLGGIDAVKTHIFSASDSFLIGFFGGETDTHTLTEIQGVRTTIKAPTFGGYAAYTYYGLSVDGSYTSSSMRTQTDDTTFSPPNISYTDLTVSTAQINANFRVDVATNWWLEATIGLSRTQLNYKSSSTFFSFSGKTLPEPLPEQGVVNRLDFGARTGGEFTVGSIKIQPSFTFIAYSDISVRGGTLALLSRNLATDEGQLWGKEAAKLNFVFSPHLSAYIEGEVHETSGTENIVGVLGTVGARYTF
jgi:hypothetical protein